MNALAVWFMCWVLLWIMWKLDGMVKADPKYKECTWLMAFGLWSSVFFFFAVPLAAILRFLFDY